MKIVLLSQHFWPESFRISEAVESLQQAGCSVSALTEQSNCPGGAVFPGYRAGAVVPQLHEAGYTIYRVRVAPRGTGTARRLIASHLSLIASARMLGPWVLRAQIDIWSGV